MIKICKFSNFTELRVNSSVVFWSEDQDGKLYLAGGYAVENVASQEDLGEDTDYTIIFDAKVVGDIKEPGKKIKVIAAFVHWNSLKEEDGHKIWKLKTGKDTSLTLDFLPALEAMTMSSIKGSGFGHGYYLVLEAHGNGKISVDR